MQELVPLLAGRRVVVVGDLTLDEYLYGRATRLSREAPIPVLELVRREAILGGAANPARNIAALGSAATQIGLVGEDAEGEQVAELLRVAGIDAPLVRCPGRPTTRKTRILADESPRLPQQLARLDRLERAPLPPAEEQAVLAALRASIPGADAVICSDYQIGMLTPAVVDTVRALCAGHGVRFCVDAQGSSHLYTGADLFRCNNLEAAAALGRPLRTPADYRAGLAELRARLGAKIVMVTRGPEGIALEADDLPYTHLPAVRVSEIYDTTGAGDTFIAVATLALAADLSAITAARLATVAAGLVVRRYGNAVVTPEEFIEALG